MSNLIIIRAKYDAHWYTKDGEPRHDATLREARKEGLFPSVTSILAIKEKPQVTNWRLGQLLAQALTIHRLGGESDEKYIDRIKAADEEEREKAPDVGRLVHHILSEHLQDPITAYTDIGVDLTPVGEWINEYVTEACPEVPLVNLAFGYAGTADCVCRVEGVPAVVDWKTQAVKLDKAGTAKPAFYDEWCWQLAAYSECVGNGNNALVSVIIDTQRPGCYVHYWTAAEGKRGQRGFFGLLEAWKADRNYEPPRGD